MKKLWRYGRWLLIPLALVVGCWLFIYISGTVRLNQAIAATESIEADWRLADIEAARAQFPDNENSALVIEAGWKLIPTAPGPSHEQFREIDAIVDKLNDLEKYPERRATAGQLSNLQSLAALYEPALVEFRKLNAMPRGRFPTSISNSGSSTDPYPTPSEHAKRVALALKFDAWNRLEVNDVPGATDRLVAQINAGRAVGDEAFSLSALTRWNVQMCALTTMMRYLAQCESNEELLARLQKELESEERESNWMTWVSSDRAHNLGLFEYYKSHPSQALADSIWGDTWEYYLFYVPGAVSSQQAAYMRYMNQLRGILQQPTETWERKLIALNKERQELPTLASGAAGGATKVGSLILRRYAMLRSMIAAIAAERYRIKHGNWPATLDDLVSAKFLANVPTDPFDGQPIRWRENPGGRLIYSVGHDVKDNGGFIDKNPMEDGADLGYQLFDPTKRRQPPPG